MIELDVYNHLKKNLKTNVYLVTPKSLPKEMVYLQKTNQYIKNYIYHATIELYCYADTLQKATELSKEVINKMIALQAQDNYSQVSLDNSYVELDEEVKKYRCVVVFDITYYED